MAGPTKHSMTELHRSTDDTTGTDIAAGKVAVTDGSGGFVYDDAGGGADTPVAHGNMGATETIDVSAGTWHTGTLNANCAITVSGFTVSEGLVVLVGITQDGTGGWDITWDTDVDFGGADDQPNQTASTITWYTLWSDAGDTTIYGAKVGGSSVTTGTPALTLSTTNNAGVATTVIATDATIAVFDATAPSTQAFGDAAATGSAGTAARRDHKHAMPAEPTSSSGGHEHVVSETHLSDGSTGLYTLDQTYESGSVIAWNTTSLARLTVTETEPDQATVSPVGSSGDAITFDYAATLA